MGRKPSENPRAREGKKQVVAHLDPTLVEAVHIRRRIAGLTVQEIIAEAVNTAVANWGRAPLLTITRDRLVKREHALAQVQTSQNAPPCRAGKRRLAAWFNKKELDEVAAFARETGVRVENLVEMGLTKMFSSEEITAAADKLANAA